MYPLNNNGQWDWGNPDNYTSLAQIAALPQIKALFSNSLGTDFTTFVMWVYTVGNVTSTWNYWCNGITAENIAAETQQFADLTIYLLSTYAGTQLSFTLEHWEGDWMARCGSYNASQPPAPKVASAMILWLQARQKGVEIGREQYCLQSNMSHVDCSNGTAVMQAAGVTVYNGCEVNLVGDSINTTFPNIIRSVVPYVALDTVSYSSYDTMSTPVLGPALDFIFSQMNRSLTSPPKPIFITEWGLGLEHVTTAEAAATAQNVIEFAVSRSDFVSRVLHWQVINNELANNTKCGAVATFDPTIQNGFWAVQPNGELSFFGTYLQGLINGTIPLP